MKRGMSDPGLILLAAMPSLDALRTPPAPPGENPFHVKGMVAQGYVQFVERHVSGGLAAVVSELGEPAYRTYFSQKFFSGSWYDLYAFLFVMRTAARLSGRHATPFIAEHSAWQANRDVHTIHRLLLLVASPETVAPRMGVAFSRYFDFGHIEVVDIQKGCLDIMIRGMPAAFVDWYKVSVQSAAQEILGLAGARGVRSWYAAAEPDGSKAGVALVRFRGRRTWTR
jgi:hypothetical protein